MKRLSFTDEVGYSIVGEQYLSCRKSTTLASMIDLINRTRSDHILTIEDPIEFVHPHKKCIVTQRQVGSQTQSFRRALRAALREDPDIVLIGEMRDLETVAIGIETAETGHLVIKSIMLARVVDLARFQLALSLPPTLL